MIIIAAIPAHAQSFHLGRCLTPELQKDFDINKVIFKLIQRQICLWEDQCSWVYLMVAQISVPWCYSSGWCWISDTPYSVVPWAVVWDWEASCCVWERDMQPGQILLTGWWDCPSAQCRAVVSSTQALAMCEYTSIHTLYYSQMKKRSVTQGKWED